MQLIYKFKEYDPKICSHRIVGLRIFFFFLRTQNSHSKGHKTLIFIDKVTFTLHPWIILIATKRKQNNNKYIHVQASNKER